MKNRLPLTKHARRLRIVVLTFAVILPLILFVAVLAMSGFLSGRVTINTDMGGVPVKWALMGAPVLCVLMELALLALARMLEKIEQGETFSPAVTHHFRRFTLFILLTAIARLIMPMVLQAARALYEGHGTVMLGLYDGGDLLLIALVLFLVARLFDEAARLDEDSRSIV